MARSEDDAELGSILDEPAPRSEHAAAKLTQPWYHGVGLFLAGVLVLAALVALTRASPRSWVSTRAMRERTLEEPSLLRGVASSARAGEAPASPPPRLSDAFPPPAPPDQPPSCAAYARVMARVEKDASSLRAFWASRSPRRDGRVPRAKMDEWVGMFERRERPFNDIMSSHHALVRDGKLYMSRRDDYYAPFMAPVIADLVRAARRAPDAEFFLFLGDEPWRRDLGLGDEAFVSRTGQGANSTNERARQPTNPYASHMGVPTLATMKYEDRLRAKATTDLVTPCYYSGLVDRVCARRDTFPAFAKREPKLLGAFGMHCPHQPAGAEAARSARLPDGRPADACPRAYFKNLSSTHPETMTVVVTRVEEDAALASRVGLEKSDAPVPLSKHVNYKYLLDTDGLGRSCKFEAMLAMGSVVLRPATAYASHFSDALEPNVHYVPVWQTKADDALDAVAYLEAHADEAAAIARAGQDFACAQIGEAARTCYWASAIAALAALAEPGTTPTPAERPGLVETAEGDVRCDESFEDIDGERSFECSVAEAGEGGGGEGAVAPRGRIVRVQ